MPHCTGRKLRTKEVKWLAQGHTTEAGQESEGPPPSACYKPRWFLFKRGFLLVLLGDRGQRPVGRKGRENPPNIKRQVRKIRREGTEKHLDQGERGWAGQWAADSYTQEQNSYTQAAWPSMRRPWVSRKENNSPKHMHKANSKVREPGAGETKPGCFRSHSDASS